MARLQRRMAELSQEVENICRQPNQSFKLTELAVDDLSRAKQIATIGRDVPRADWIWLRRLFAAAG